MIELTAMTTSIGAEVSGIDLREPLDEQAHAAIRRGAERRNIDHIAMECSGVDHVRFPSQRAKSISPA